MQSTNLPSKYLVPFAKNDGSKVEIPVTTATAGRASQSLGFPPITGQPPEAGGLPPQLEDFNGAINQIARVTWWSQLGGKFPFDNAFATDTNINGYPLGAELLSSDNAGTWLSVVDNNVANPDTTGTGWVPARAYGVLALTGQTGGTTTPTPVQAMKRRVTIAGALTSNLIVVLPNWVYSWDITNNTSGAFTVTVKTAAGAGVVVPQNGAPTPVTGDGTNIGAVASNVPTPTTPTQAAQFGQTTGRLLNVQTFATPGTFTYTPTAGTTRVRVTVIGGGGGGGGTVATSATNASLGGPGSAGSACQSFYTSGFSGVAVVVGATGSVAIGAAGGAGGTSSFAATPTPMSAPGGNGGNNNLLVPPSTQISGTPGAIATGGNVYNAQGAPGGTVIASNPTNGSKGFGGPSILGYGPGRGGDGTITVASSAATAGQPGLAGIVIVEEYS